MNIQQVEYRDEGALLEASVAYRAGTNTKLPTVLVFHAWRGRDEFARKKAESLAELGYVGVAVDLFGKGVLAKSNEEASKLIEPFMKDRLVLKKRILTAFSAISSQPFVDPSRMAAIGYCFGGLCVLDLVRCGAPVRGVVSFHGLLTPPSYPVESPITSKVLVLHGNDDPMVSHDEVRAFQNEMTAYKTDWEMQIYGHKMHAFTNPQANDPAFGTVYDSSADKRSWLAMRNFLETLFS